MLEDNYFELRTRVKFSCAYDTREKSNRNFNHYLVTYAKTQSCTSGDQLRVPLPV